jgi:hypothetical protein
MLLDTNRALSRSSIWMIWFARCSVIDLQIEMIPAISNHSHAVLFHQHEGGEYPGPMRLLRKAPPSSVP